MNNDIEYSEQQQAFYGEGYRPEHPLDEPVQYGQAQAQQFQQPILQQPMHMPLYEDRPSTAVICYAFGWLTGLLFLLFAQGNRYLRFHALQSFIFFGAINVIDFAFLFSIHAYTRFFFIPEFMFGMGFLLLNFIAFVGWIVAMVQAGRGIYYRLPFIGNAVARFVGLDTTLLK